MIKISTFCSGIGAAEQAIKELGVNHEVVFCSEIDKYARLSYLANHTTSNMINDMTKCDYVGDEYYSDLNISGLPCQTFSLAGLRKGESDSRGLLFYDFYRYVKNQQPKVFIIENVKGLLSDNKGKTFQNWLLLLGRSVNSHEQMFIHEDSLEYNLHYTVLNSKNFGVPQNRERVFIVGIRKDLPNDFRFPIGWRLDKRLRDVLETNVEEKYYLSEKMQSYLINRKDNFNGGKINYKNENDVASCINASSKSIDISDNIIIEKVGFINQDTQASQVYDTNGISPTLSAGTHGYALGYIEVKEIANTSETSCNQVVVEPLLIKFSRTENAKQQRRETGTNNFQDKQIEFVKSNLSNTITTVQKDNLIVEPQVINPLKDKTEFGWHFEQNVFDVKGITRALKSSEGSGNKMKIIEPQLNQIAQLDGFESEGRIYDANGIARTIKDGGGGGSKTGWYKVDEDWVTGGLQKHQTPRKDGICPTSTSAIGMGGGQTPITPHNSKIRRLTPLEVFRLQAFPDDFFYKCKAVNSDSQLYKQAGNSITVNVMREIINNLIHILG